MNPPPFLDIHYQLQLLDLLKRLNQQQQLSIITVLHDVNPGSAILAIASPSCARASSGPLAHPQKC